MVFMLANSAAPAAERQAGCVEGRLSENSGGTDRAKVEGGLRSRHATAGRILRSAEETRPVLCGMKDTDYHDCLLEWLVKDEVVTELRHDEPADLRVSGPASRMRRPSSRWLIFPFGCRQTSKMKTRYKGCEERATLGSRTNEIKTPTGFINR